MIMMDVKKTLHMLSDQQLNDLVNCVWAMFSKHF